jgi:mannose/fructose/N-acetylgalactosamine-specific phosphotransferase system component IID
MKNFNGNDYAFNSKTQIRDVWKRKQIINKNNNYEQSSKHIYYQSMNVPMKK